MSAMLLDHLTLAIRRLKTRKVRVLLTVLGIAIGIAAVLGTVSLGEGIRMQAVETIRASSDLTLIEATPGNLDGTSYLITPSSVEHIRSVPYVTASSAILKDSYASQHQTYLPVIGADGEEISKVLDLRVETGRMYTSGSAEAVLGADLGEYLRRYEGMQIGSPFPVMVREYDDEGRPRDREIAITPVGILSPRDDRYDSALILDRELVAAEKSGQQGFDAVLIRTGDHLEVAEVAGDLRELGFSAGGAFEQIEAVNRFMDVVILIFAIFAGVSLVVGGLMIANTMMISVYEQTREIGISMALGAAEGDVMRMVLLECLLLGIMGGVAGIAASLAFSSVLNVVGRPLLLSRLGGEFSGLFGDSLSVITPPMLIAGLGIAIVLSLLSGIYPAYRAARLDPIEAMRS
ncbi:MAG: ABC transporter permease [Methanolinea sp.]